MDRLNRGMVSSTVHTAKVNLGHGLTLWTLALLCGGGGTWYSRTLQLLNQETEFESIFREAGLSVLVVLLDEPNQHQPSR